MSHPVREHVAASGLDVVFRSESVSSADSGTTVRVAVDMSGGDADLMERVSGALEAARLYPAACIMLCGPESEVAQCVDGMGGLPDNVEVVDAPQHITMHEMPVQALRSKPRSSIAVGVDLVANGDADAFVSAGNTGAVAAASTLKLGRLRGVQRPGIASVMQMIDKVAVAIDLGANVDCKPIQLLQYGIMASVFAEGIVGIKNPRVGLLNVGAEAVKGNDLSKQSFELLHCSDLNFIGNVEPEQFFSGACDVLVCDGFVGNVLLKVSESLIMKLMGWLKQEVSGRLRYKLGYLLCRDLFNHLKECADYAEYGGAPLLGVNGITIITHGTSDARAIRNAIREACCFVEYHVNERIEAAILQNASSRGVRM